MKNEKKEQMVGRCGNDNEVPSRKTLTSHNVTVLGKRTSIRLEPEMWQALQEISKREGCRISDICSLVSLRKDKSTSLTGAIRVFLMLYYRAATTNTGHDQAGHGDFKNMINRAGVSEEFFPRHAKKGKNSSVAVRPTYLKRKITPVYKPDHQDVVKMAHVG